ncbi:MAG: hypothetical protein ACFFFO_03785 [Candidatus Thorarchaeota archaeon]
MISISKDLSTRLQALYHSGEVSGYIYSKLPEDSMKTGWIEQGILSMGMKGKLRDKHNQESLVIPADRFARLVRDMSSPGAANILVIGPKGLTESKFVAMVLGKKNSQSIIAFQVQNQSPLEIIRFLLEYGLGKNVSKSFVEPNLDYVEQLRMDTNEKLVNDVLVLSLPKASTKMTEWIKAIVQEGSSEDLLIRHGSSKDLPIFSALLTRWITGLELFRGIRSAIVACVFVKDGIIDVCFWDSPQRIAAFASITGVGLEEISRKYLVPIWMVPGDSFRPPKKMREVVLEARVSQEPKKAASTREELSSDDVKRSLESLRSRLDKLSLSDFEKRLDVLESKFDTTSGSSTVEKGSLDALQTRLAENIDRIEILTKRLLELEQRIKKISTSR